MELERQRPITTLIEPETVTVQIARITGAKAVRRIGIPN